MNSKINGLESKEVDDESLCQIEKITSRPNEPMTCWINLYGSISLDIIMRNKILLWFY